MEDAVWLGPKGSGVLERGNDVIHGDKGVTVQMQDTVAQPNGTMRILLPDETRVDSTEHARLTIDEFHTIPQMMLVVLTQSGSWRCTL